MFSLKSAFSKSSSITQKYSKIIDQINALEPDIQALSDSALYGKTAEFRTRLAKGELLDLILPEVFATVREAAKRTTGLRPFDEQLIGALVLHTHGIAEMKTGEGKTLVATLPAYLNALLGKGVHVITVNDYLARRDAVWMGQIYSSLGMTVGVINTDKSYVYDPSQIIDDPLRDKEGSFHIVHEFLKPSLRKESYSADVTYGTNSEFGFDYLRDNISYDPNELRQRGHFFAIVDEIDSILIDEARTPLIISAPTAESEDLYKTFSHIAKQLNPEVHYTVDEKRKAIQLTDLGIDQAEKLLGIDNIYTEKGIKYVHHLETAVRAQALFHKDKEYVVREGGVTIVDEFTGRLQPGRRWSEGLHQAIEAKEGVEVQKESRTFASITYQNYFRLYEKLSGMTGTAKTSSEEFYSVYKLDVIEIPTHKPIIRKDANDLIFQTEKGKFSALARSVKELHKKGQPVLVGTVSIEKNELLSAYLKREGVPHEILNAKNHEREGEIIAQAGTKGKVTVATNMAGRGVDIKLGGALAEKNSYEDVKNLGGLVVIGTERHEARRIDNQLRGRAGRQGDPGMTQFYVSLEDNLMRVFASDSLRNLMGRFGIPEDEPIENGLVTRSLESAQTKIEGFNFDTRKQVLEFDNVLDRQRRVIYERRRLIMTGSVEDVNQVLNELVDGQDETLSILKKKEEEFGKEQFMHISRSIILQTLDALWVEHLESMEYLRGSVSLRAYGQREPITEYRREGLRLYKEMEFNLKERVIEIIKGLQKEKEFASSVIPTQQVTQGRNDLCPCGSQKKYKNCGMRDTEEHKRLMLEKRSS